MTCSPTRRSTRPSRTVGSKISNASGDPSWPCFGADSGSVKGDSTVPIGLSRSRPSSMDDRSYVLTVWKACQPVDRVPLSGAKPTRILLPAVAAVLEEPSSFVEAEDLKLAKSDTIRLG